MCTALCLSIHSLLTFFSHFVLLEPHILKGFYVMNQDKRVHKCERGKEKYHNVEINEILYNSATSISAVQSIISTFKFAICIRKTAIKPGNETSPKLRGLGRRALIKAAAQGAMVVLEEQQRIKAQVGESVDR